MKINYQETTKDLQVRINIHDQFGGRNIDEWMLDLLKLQKGSKILDVGCGAGKQCFKYHDYLNGDCEIIGGDVSQELLQKAKTENEKRGLDIKFRTLNFNEKFPFEDNTFDLISCSFAIYYAEDIPFTISEMHRVLKPGGRLFTTGPLPENKQMFYDVIREATGKVIPPMPGSSRYKSGIYASVQELFSVSEMNVFENPLTFPTSEPFVQYTRASLSEDRKLWNDFFNGEKEFEDMMTAISRVADKWLARDGKLVMTKVVGGILATK